MKFYMDPDEHLLADSTGFRIEQNFDGVIALSQNAYRKTLDVLSQDASFLHSRSMRMKFDWIYKIRLNCLFVISQGTHVTESIFEKGPDEIIS